MASLNRSAYVYQTFHPCTTDAQLLYRIHDTQNTTLKWQDWITNELDINGADLLVLCVFLAWLIYDTSVKNIM